MAFASVSSQALLPGKAQAHKFPSVLCFFHETLIIFGRCCGLLKTFVGTCQLVKPLKVEMPWPRVGEEGAAPWGRGRLQSGA